MNPEIERMRKEKENVGIPFEEFPYADKLIEFLEHTNKECEIVSIEPFGDQEKPNYYVTVLIEDTFYYLSFNHAKMEDKDILVLIADYCYVPAEKRVSFYDEHRFLLAYY